MHATPKTQCQTERFTINPMVVPCASLLIYALSLSISPTSSQLTAAEPPLVAGFERASRAELPAVEQANLLISELGCRACHQGAKPGTLPKPAPSLAGVSQRLNHQWVVEFLENPAKSKPGTTMPHLLGHLPPAERQATVEKLSHYLGSLAAPQNMFDLKVHVAVHPTVPRYWEKGDPQLGKQLYNTVGCIACHPMREQEENKAKSRLETLRDQGYDEDEIAELVAASGAAVHVPEVPHPNFSQKYQQQALAVFLFDPHRFRAGGRMPATKLSPSEAADLVAYLTADSEGDGKRQAPVGWSNVDKNLAEQGRALFDSLGCVQCHASEKNPKSTAPTWKTIVDKSSTTTKGCLASRPSPADYSLSDSQRRIIQQSFAEQAGKAATSSPEQLTMMRFNCYACHRRGSIGGVGIDRWHHFETRGKVDLGDEGRVPPALTGVGAKLQNAWTAKVLKGEGDIRPHLQIRMPIFRHVDVDALPLQLEAADDGSKKKDVDVFEKVATTAAMAIADTGCIQCHALTEEYLPGVVGVEIAGMRERIRPVWFRDFLRNPGELKRRTRMPTFFPQGRSSRPDLLNGNIDKQIASLWWYLADAKGIELPDKLAAGRVHNFELVPDKEPIVLRTFFDKAGTHAICVGSPEKVHFAFDSRQVRMAVAWKGRFLDAHGTWYDRFVPPAKPLGTDVMIFPEGPGVHSGAAPLPWPKANNLLRMKGYRLIDGTPTFRYQHGDTQIHDRLTPHADGLQRTLELIQPTEPLWIQLAVGKKIEKGAASIQVDGLTLKGDALERAVVVGTNPRRIALQIGRVEQIGDKQEPVTITIHYHW